MSETTFERHYSIGELEELWGYGRETIRKLIRYEPGVVRVQLGRKKANVHYSIPSSVAERIHTRLTAA